MLPDLLAPGLRVVFVGTSVSTTSAARAHYYTHASNRFWELLEATGLTGSAGLTSERDREIVSCGVGLTDLVKGRAASSDALLSEDDYDVPAFVGRVERFEPQVVAFNGQEATRRLARHLGHRVPEIGPTGWSIAGSRTYYLPSSSGANARGGFGPKLAAWQRFGEWVRSDD
jgi:TDG/mug DNA glycosylase family protein